MYARKDIRTVLPDAVLRCRKLQAAADSEMDEMEKSKLRRLNTLDWQQQSFQRTLTEKHKRWRVYDRAFRLKLKRELGADLAAALRLRTIQDEEEKFLFEQQLIEQSLSHKKGDNNDEEEEVVVVAEKQQPSTAVVMPKSTSAHPKSNQMNTTVDKGSKSAVDPRRAQTAATKISQSTDKHDASKLSPRRPRTSRFDPQNRRDTDPSLGLRNDFGSVLLRILSNIAATPDLDDEYTIRKRALEARERRLILTKDNRYFDLVNELAPQKIPGEKVQDDSDDENSQ